MSALAAALLTFATALAGVLPLSTAAVTPAFSSTAQPGTRWAWPVDPAPAVVRPFTPPPTPYSAGHRGVDLLAPVGTVVLAPADGVVAFAGRVAGRVVVAVQHDGGRRSAVEPVLPLVTRGARVARGDPVAVVAGGTGHCTPRACLHWGVRQDGRYVDPLSLVGASLAPAVLLPLRAAPEARAGPARAGSARAGPARPGAGSARAGPAWPGAGPARAGPGQRWPATSDAARPWPPWWTTTAG